MTAFPLPHRDSGPPQTILHLDLDAFFCAVEELRQPESSRQGFCRRRTPRRTWRGLLLFLRRAQVRNSIRDADGSGGAPASATPGRVSGRHGVYGEMSEQVMRRLRNVTPGFEQISIDEAFLDITGMREPPEILARRLQVEIRDDLGLPSSIGIASNKLVAKIATEVGKKAGRGDRPPFGLTIVPRGEERSFLAPLPMEMLWGVGPKTGKKLATPGHPHDWRHRWLARIQPGGRVRRVRPRAVPPGSGRGRPHGRD